MLAYCHSNGVCHHDIKMDNIGINVRLSSDHNHQPQILDFGICKSFGEKLTNCGTRHYKADELFHLNQLQDAKVTGEPDMASLGYTVLAAFGYEGSRVKPSGNYIRDRRLNINAFIKANRGHTMSSDLIDFVEHLLSPRDSMSFYAV